MSTQDNKSQNNHDSDSHDNHSSDAHDNDNIHRSHSHGHSHKAHSHGHSHDISQENITIAFFLNFCFTIIEFIGGYLTNSTAILADAVHDLGDTISIGLSWILQKIGKKPADTKFTYGYPRLSLLGAVINGIVLTIGSILVISKAIPRLFDPVMPAAVGMFWLAILGVAVNGYAAYRLSTGKTMNERVLNWHLMEDVLGWVAILIISCVLFFVELPILDPILSIIFTLFILYNVLRNLKETIKIFLQASPDMALHNDINRGLLKIEHVCGIHHLHLWSLDGEKNVLTAHLLIDTPIDSEAYQSIKRSVAKFLAPYNLEHTTIELENNEEVCRDSN